jgi:hypothetical protein
MRLSLSILALIMSPCWSLTAAETTGVIVDKAMPVEQLTRERVIDLLTGRAISLPDGKRAILVLSYGPAGQAAVQDLAARDVARLMRGWKRLVFGAGGSMPLTAADDHAAYELLARTPSAVLPITRPTSELPASLRFVPLESP